MVKVAFVKVFSGILQESNKGMMITDEQGTRYLGALCDPEKNWVDESIEEVVTEKEVELDEVVSTYLQMATDAGMKVYDSTAYTMRWWGYLHGLFPEYKEA